MRVLVCGSSGCIGRAVVQSLRWRGHHVVAASPSHEAATGGDALAIDFMRPTPPHAWAALLAERGIETLVNCAGIPMPAPDASVARVHRDGPIELFNGACDAGVTRIVQVSALGTGSARGTVDDALLAMHTDAAVVRPSLVYGPGSRADAVLAPMSRLPLIALPGDGEQRLQPIHVFEVAEAIAALVERTGSARGVYELGGGDVVSVRQLLAAYRGAQGFGRGRWLPLPLALLTAAAALAERLPQKPFGRQALHLLRHGSVVTRNAAPVLLGRAATPLREGLQVTPPRPPALLPAARRAPARAGVLPLPN